MNEEQNPPEDVISNELNQLTDLQMEHYQRSIKKARNTLFVLAGLVLIGELLSANFRHYEITPLLAGIIALETGIFAALGFWANTRPFAAISIGLILFIGLWLLVIVVNGFSGAIGGIIIRLVIIGYLASALKDAKAWEDAKKRKL